MTAPAKSTRVYPAQWRLALATLDAVIREGRAADRLLQAGFRQNPKMGGRDRATVGTLVYGVLRDLRRLERIAGSRKAEALTAIHVLDAGLADAAGLSRLGVEDAPSLVARVAAHDDSALTEAERLNVPDAIHARWLTQFGADQTAALAEALRRQAPVDLRVNSLRATRDQALAALADAGIDAVATRWSPLGIRMPQRAPLQGLALFRDGGIEPQDEGSQLLAELVAAQPGETLADYCAGAGGKTLALAARMQNRGQIWACDTDARRLQKLAPRLRRAGVENVQVLALADAERVAPIGTFDAVLVDAPCSGTGTWRRQPEARLRQLDFEALADLQLRILEAAARWVHPGGRLVYATCSLMREENEAVVERFVAGHPEFAIADAGALLAAAGIDLPGTMLNLLPHRHGTDGFFGAVLRRQV